MPWLAHRSFNTLQGFVSERNTVCVTAAAPLLRRSLVEFIVVDHQATILQR